MSINHEERAYRAWPILVGRAAQKRTITHGELGRELGIHHRAVRHVLGLIQDYCLDEKLHPLTIIVVDRNGRIGSGFIAYDIDNAEEGQRLVYSYKWSLLENPFSFASDGTSVNNLAQSIIDNPESSENVYHKVKCRGYSQVIFRRALLNLYGGCAITGITIHESLDACHIIPWSHSTPNQRLDVRNGLLMNRFHHSLFDKELMTISSDYRIIFCKRLLKRSGSSEYNKKMISDIHGQKLRLPRSIEMRPSIELISSHNQSLKWIKELG